MNTADNQSWLKDAPLVSFTFLPLVSHHSARFVLFLFIALLFHAFIIFKISFSMPEKIKQTPKTLDIIINLVKTDHKIKKANYFAQSNQKGGGQQESKNKPTNVISSRPKTTQTVIKELLPIKKLVDTQIPKKIIKSIIKSEFSSHKKSKIKALKLQKKKPKLKKKIKTKKLKKPLISIDYLANLKQQIVDLEADIDTKTKVYSRRSKHKYVNASTAKAIDAQYIRQWTRKIERIGNLNYPTAAKKKSLSGKLILAVTINAQGKLINIKIRKSSKHKLLDDAAIRIVRLSAPYAPVPKNVLQGNNALVITRTWLFTQKSSGSFLMK